MIFALYECREREKEMFLEREPLELELVMGPTVFVLFFFFNGETVVLTSEF